ncbi:type II toxin-antitoxin system RelE/ParE family toxin [Sulfurimonas sp. CVO]|uniref:type II toxin-antitoxin system RelE/ParE family toxin n=1 Tax=Sulfurimonas sp. CVO TaxID=2283483 RepID=UPI00132F38B6|nr:type II toxin-antitoxin system RelE/ParE family toxin [Sulfurimonas sp. CVO]QHG91752.1 type II toxin-antitoxin system RelE/ParE family toxin [Sulfurimonas sp. CVO]
MKILKREEFNREFKEILYFIAQDSKANAKKFKNELIKKVNDLEFMPYKFRKSIYFNNDSIRDLVFKGYVIVYSIDEQEDIEKVYKI